MDKLPFGCDSLDAILDGGVESGCMTLLYGEAGTGKTTLCLILARDMAKAEEGHISGHRGRIHRTSPADRRSGLRDRGQEHPVLEHRQLR